MEQIEIHFNESRNEMEIICCENCRWNGQQGEYHRTRCESCKQGNGLLYFQSIPTAAELFVEFFQAGHYPQMKSLEHQMKGNKKKNQLGIVDVLREKLEARENKRHEFKDFNVVAKFVAKSVYDVNQRGINEYLHEYYGLFLPIAKIDYTKAKKEGKLDIIKPFIQYTPYSVVPYFNKHGKLEMPNNDFSCKSVNDLVKTWRKLKMEHQQLEQSYETLKKQMEKCPVLQKARKLEHKFGSLSLKAKNPIYSMTRMIEELGEEFVLEYGQPDPFKLEQLALQGIFNMRELDQFKTLIDVRLDFVVMPLDSERKAMEFHTSKQMLAAQNRRK